MAALLIALGSGHSGVRLKLAGSAAQHVQSLDSRRPGGEEGGLQQGD